MHYGDLPTLVDMEGITSLKVLCNCARQTGQGGMKLFFDLKACITMPHSLSLVVVQVVM